MSAFAFSLLALTASAQVSITPNDCLFSRDQTFFVGEPVVLVAPKVHAAYWSSTGRYLLVERQELPHTPFELQSSLTNDFDAFARSLVVVDPSSNKSTPVIRFTGRNTRVVSVDWIPGTSRAIVVMQQYPEDKSLGEPAYHLYTVDAASGQSAETTPWGDLSPMNLSVVPSPAQPYVYVSAVLDTPSVEKVEGAEVEKRFHERAFIFGGSGEPQEAQVPEAFFAAVASWSADGKRLYCSLQERQNGKSQQVWYQVDLRGDSPKKISPPADAVNEAPRLSGDVRTRLVPLETANSGTHRQVMLAWAETRDLDGPNRVLVSGDAQWAEVGPKGDLIAYIADGTLMARPVITITRDAYDESILEAARSKAVRDAKQVGIAATILATDNDDTLPSPSTFSNDVKGYLVNGRALDSFVYTFPGGRLTDLKSPATVELGYIPVTGGRVVLFADTSVRFVPGR